MTIPTTNFGARINFPFLWDKSVKCRKNLIALLKTLFIIKKGYSSSKQEKNGSFPPQMKAPPYTKKIILL